MVWREGGRVSNGLTARQDSKTASREIWRERERVIQAAGAGAGGSGTKLGKCAGAAGRAGRRRRGRTIRSFPLWMGLGWAEQSR